MTSHDFVAREAMPSGNGHNLLPESGHNYVVLLHTCTKFVATFWPQVVAMS